MLLVVPTIDYAFNTSLPLGILLSEGGWIAHRNTLNHEPLTLVSTISPRGVNVEVSDIPQFESLSTRDFRATLAYN